MVISYNIFFHRNVSVKVFTLPVAAEPTLRATKHLQQVTKSDKRCTCQLEVAEQRDCLEERFCFVSKWSLYRVGKLMSSQRTTPHAQFSPFHPSKKNMVTKPFGAFSCALRLFLKRLNRAVFNTFRSVEICLKE